MSSIDQADDDLKLLFQHLSAVADTNKVMLVGARCRDILHRRYSAVPPQRKTGAAGVCGVQGRVGMGYQIDPLRYGFTPLLLIRKGVPRVSRDEP